MYVSKSLQWVKPYLDKLGKRLPNIKQPKSIRVYHHKRKPKSGAMGVCTKGGSKITLAPNFHRIGRVGEWCKKGEIDLTAMLSTLAHEIAHLHHWEHGPEHEGITRAIFEAFNTGTECPHCLGVGRVIDMERLK